MADLEKYPAESELDELMATPFENECQVLCEILKETLADLPTDTGHDRIRDLAILRSVRARMKSLHCKPCTPS
jgi:hypothetical protein